MQVFPTHILSGRQCPIHARTCSRRVPTLNRYAFWLLPSVFCLLLTAAPATALPPPEDLPEEILRTEIITEARSPIDGQPLTAAEYAQLQAQQPELWADNLYTQSPIACPSPDFLSCQTNHPNHAIEPNKTGAFSATNHIINKLPIRYLLRRMFPF